MKAILNGRKFDVKEGKDGFWLKTNLPFPVKLMIGEPNKLVVGVPKNVKL